MPVEFIGMISTRDQSETRRSRGPVVDRDYVRRFARAHEDAGFDRVLIGYSSSQPDGTQVAAYAAAHTERLSFLVAHRPGFVAPTLAARTFATLDQFAGGRIAVHIITGGSDGEQRRDGDHLSKDERYERTDEYLDILKQAWTSDAPFDHDGRYYRSRTPTPTSARRSSRRSRCTSAARRMRPTESAASTPTSTRCGASRWPRPRSRSPRCMPPPHRPAASRPRGSASRSVRSSGRPRNSRGSGHTRSSRRRGRTSRNSAASGAGRRSRRRAPAERRLPAAAGRGRQGRAPRPRAVDAARRRHRRRRATHGAGRHAGTVAQALLDYVDIGVTTLLIRGYDPYDDAIDYGRQLLPLVREEVSRRDQYSPPVAVPLATATE